MKRALLIGAIVLASGCSVDNTSTTQNDSTVRQTDEATGLVLEPSQKMYVTFSEMTSIYQDTMACVGLYAGGPTVQFVDFPTFMNYPAESTGTGGWGVYDPTGSWTKFWGGGELVTHVVLINNHDTIVGTDRDNRTDTEVLIHEFIHHILNVNGVDWKHSNPLFGQCGVGVNTYN